MNNNFETIMKNNYLNNLINTNKKTFKNLSNKISEAMNESDNIEEVVSYLRDLGYFFICNSENSLYYLFNHDYNVDIDEDVSDAEFISHINYILDFEDKSFNINGVNIVVDNLIFTFTLSESIISVIDILGFGMCILLIFSHNEVLILNSVFPKENHYYIPDFYFDMKKIGGDNTKEIADFIFLNIDFSKKLKYESQLIFDINLNYSSEVILNNTLNVKKHKIYF